MARTKSMKFQTNHGSKFKKAIESLSQSNTKGFGIIDVDSNNGVKISSLDDDSNSSFILLEPSNLIDFYCGKNLNKKMVNLKFLLRMLQVIEEEDIILFQEDGTNNLYFESARYPGMTLGVGLQEINANFKPYSGTMSHTCETFLPCKALETIIPEMVKDGFSQLVSLDITSSVTKISIGDMEWEFTSNKEIGETTGVTSGQKYHVEFLWSRLDSLNAAITLTDKCTFAVLASEYIKLQFQFEEGSLVFIKRPISLISQ